MIPRSSDQRLKEDQKLGMAGTLEDQKPRTNQKKDRIRNGYFLKV